MVNKTHRGGRAGFGDHRTSEWLGKRAPRRAAFAPAIRTPMDIKWSTRILWCVDKISGDADGCFDKAIAADHAC